MDEITELQAEILKTLASPRRLDILHRLSESPCEVGRLAEELELAQPNVSQHLAVLRAAGLVEAEREGREVLERRLDRLASLVSTPASRSTTDEVRPQVTHG
jgi:DNA-binding transcriptional ArsR family regulator